MRRWFASILALLVILAAVRPAVAHLHNTAGPRSVAHHHLSLGHSHAEEDLESHHTTRPLDPGLRGDETGQIVYFKLTPTAPKPPPKVAALRVEQMELRIAAPRTGAVFLADPPEPTPPRGTPLQGRAPPSVTAS